MKIPYAMALLFWDCSKCCYDGIRRATALRAPILFKPILFEFQGLVLAVIVKRRSPDLVRCLVFSATKTEIGSKTQVEIARVLQDVDKLLGIELRSSTFKPLDQNVGRNVAIQRHVIRRFAGKIFGKRILVFENNGRVAGN